MKNELPDTQAELLTYLRDNPKGQTTAQLFATAKQRRYMKFKNSTIISACINAMRAKNLVTTSDAHGGKVHKITQLGFDQLSDENGYPPLSEQQPDGPKPVTMAALADNIIQKVQTPMELPIEEPITMPDQDSTRIHLESLFDQIRELVAKEMIKIADKPTKLAVLERVSGFVREDDAAWLDRIRADLELMEAE